LGEVIKLMEALSEPQIVVIPEKYSEMLIETWKRGTN